MGNNVKIRAFTHIYASSKCNLVLSDDVEIGRDSTISCHNRIILEKGVLTGPHVFIADHNHQYTDPNIHITKQGIYPTEGIVTIGEGSWLGTNVVIAGNVSIGKHCVIGANSVVTKDIPDYCVAAGIPAKVIKQYNTITKKWERI